MSLWNSAGLLTQFNRLARRPSVDAITDATKYEMLARAQVNVIGQIAGIYPDGVYQAPAALTTSDNQIFTFGTDGDGNAVAPMGFVGIYPSLESIPDYPLEPGLDYLDEGTQIRIPHNSTWSGTLYGRWIPTPSDISASTQPALNPAPARRLIVLQAVMDFAAEGGGRPEIYAAAEREWAKAWPSWLMQWRTRFRTGGIVGVYQFPVSAE